MWQKLQRYWLLLPVGIYLFLQLILHLCIDLSDVPGAAGTWSIYRAATDGFGKDNAARLYSWISSHTPLSLYNTQTITAPVLGMLSVSGIVFCARGFGSQRSALLTGLLSSCWVIPHYFGLLAGNDTLSFALSWLGVGLFIYGIGGSYRLWPIGMLGLSLLALAVQTKELALPVIGVLLLTPLALPKPKWNWFIAIPLFIYTAYWSYAWMWPDQSTRLSQRPDLHIQGLQKGWYRIIELYERGLSEGKFDQIAILSILLGSLSLFKKRWK
ncbi:MAG: hypothetical protein CMK59_14280, partial [Proteobacteria bacterium]|nr:hypothetical protein [Pseudomonadota bacterium]